MNFHSSSSSQFAPPPRAIISPLFCSPNPVELTFFTKAPWLNPDQVAVTDINGHVLLKVEDRWQSFRNWKVIIDGSGQPVISVQQKCSSLHDRWQVFRGSSADAKDLLFSVKRSSVFQSKTELDVFLAGNFAEDAVDFKIKGSYKKKSCSVYEGDSSTVVAQMSKEYKILNNSASSPSKENKDAFGVAVASNVDICFVAALVIIRRQLSQDGDVLAETIGGIAGQAVSIAFS